MSDKTDRLERLVGDMLKAQHKQEREDVRATRLIRTLCNRAPESPGCLYPACDCGTAPPMDE